MIAAITHESLAALALCGIMVLCSGILIGLSRLESRLDIVIKLLRNTKP